MIGGAAPPIMLDAETFHTAPQKGFLHELPAGDHPGEDEGAECACQLQVRGLDVHDRIV